MPFKPFFRGFDGIDEFTSLEFGCACGSFGYLFFYTPFELEEEIPHSVEEFLDFEIEEDEQYDIIEMDSKSITLHFYSTDREEDLNSCFVRLYFT